jgi:hypothetical protein
MWVAPHPASGGRNPLGLVRKLLGGAVMVTIPSLAFRLRSGDALRRRQGRITFATLLALSLAVSHGRADEPPVIIKPAPPEGTPPASEFLRPPGQDRYDSTDWRNVPPWRQASFFGVRAQGQVFVYVVDCSGSMAEADRLVRAKRELRRSIANLRFPQRFQVIFYNTAPISLPGGVPQPADWPHKNQLHQWLRLIDATGDTDPRAALAQALALRPDAIFLLSDGLFPAGTPAALAQMNARRKIPIHCIDLTGGASDDLKQIARASGGQYAARP